jgi:hypothetical protein
MIHSAHKHATCCSTHTLHVQLQRMNEHVQMQFGTSNDDKVKELDHLFT